MNIISSTNVKTRECIFIYKLSATFPFKFYQCLPVFDFLMLTDQEQVLKTHLPLDYLARKSHMELGW